LLVFQFNICLHVSRPKQGSDSEHPVRYMNIYYYVTLTDLCDCQL